MTNLKIRFIDEIDNLLTDSICEKDEKKRLEFFYLPKPEVEEFLLHFPEEADASHMMGLVIYEFPGYEKLFVAEKYFADAVEKQPTHQFAMMYLGHCYFDTKRFSEAIACFEKIDEDYFISDDKFWRVIKLRELILCCKIQMGLSKNFLNEFNQFISELKRGLDETPVPAEFAFTLAETKNSSFWQSIDREKIVEDFSQILIELGYKKILSDSIKRF